MARRDGRAYNKLRNIKITKNCSKHATGSCLIEFGDTKVLCTAVMEENVPPFLKNSGTGWVTAEYGMLPASCPGRIKRNVTSGRMHEIQRLIGRSLRSVIDLKRLGERTIKIDCDVIQADGGTRTASITGGFIALVLAFQKLKQDKIIDESPVTDMVAAISVGICDGKNFLDLDYKEDSGADMDMNVVMVAEGKFVEVQGTAEKNLYSKSQMDALLKLAEKGIEDLFRIQKKALGDS